GCIAVHEPCSPATGQTQRYQNAVDQAPWPVAEPVAAKAAARWSGVAQPAARGAGFSSAPPIGFPASSITRRPGRLGRLYARRERPAPSPAADAARPAEREGAERGDPGPASH